MKSTLSKAYQSYHFQRQLLKQVPKGWIQKKRTLQQICKHFQNRTETQRTLCRSNMSGRLQMTCDIGKTTVCIADKSNQGNPMFEHSVFKHGNALFRLIYTPWYIYNAWSRRCCSESVTAAHIQNFICSSSLPSCFFITPTDRSIIQTVWSFLKIINAFSI